MRLGIFGGSFDPPHVGHLLAATDALERLALDRLMFVPAARSPFKPELVPAPAAARLAMVRALVGDDPRFGVEPLEIERAGLSYTVDTVAALAARHPGAELVLLVGADAAAALDGWKDVPRLLSLARLAVLRRGGEVFAFPPGVTGEVLETRRVDVSSTEVRARVRAGRSIRGFVPESVAAAIAAAGLYR